MKGVYQTTKTIIRWNKLENMSARKGKHIRGNILSNMTFMRNY